MKQIFIESIVRDDPNDRGQNLLFVITYSVNEKDGTIRRFKKKSCGVISSAELHKYDDADFLFVGFECVNLDENTEELKV